ncbi:MAG: hypothetical protein M1818_007974 [Claussenomyces sp. TS43310]|nr:MAG: hypothetical protein M1818_007974 [Claussenomyces sp. TS43310]
MAGDQPSALIIRQKSDSDLTVALHPLVLLTVSDYITRHTLRQQRTPIVGALLGQQNGRETTIEHAFECKADGAGGSLDLEWFEIRLQQMKDVHKAPPLDLVGWYTTMPVSGPQQHHIPIQTQLSSLYTECSLLLGFHPTAVLKGAVGGKLPLTIYESTIESLKSNGREDIDMTNDEPGIKVTYKEVPYTVETGDAEMIAVDFVAKGGGNATAVETPAASISVDTPPSKGKERAAETSQAEDQTVLTREDEELIASLTAKANAIKMLQARINLITTYLEKLPPAYIAGQTFDASEAAIAGHTAVSHSILRSVQALLNRAALLIPANTNAFAKELLSEQNDVNLINLLGTLTESIKGAREVGQKFAIVEKGKGTAGKKGAKGDGTSFDVAFNRPSMGVGDLML